MPAIERYPREVNPESCHARQARPLFLDSWMEQGLKVLTLEGTTDAPMEAEAYTAAMKV